MFKRTLIASALCALSATFVGCSKAESNNAPDHLNFVPADTILFAQSQGMKEMADFMQDYPLVRTSDLISMKPMFEQFMQTNPKAMTFFTSLGKGIFNNQDYTYGNLVDGLGISPAGTASMYFHGIYPVIRFDLSDVKPFNDALTKAIADSDWQPKEMAYGEAKAKLWDLGSKNDKASGLSFAVLTHNNQLSLTIINANESADIQKQKLGLMSVSNPINKTEKIATLASTHGLLKNQLGFIDIKGIAQGLIDPENSSFGKSLTSQLDNEQKTKLNGLVNAACKTDYAKFYNAVPTLAFGYKSINFKGDTAIYDAAFNIEITNTDVTKLLSSLNGHVPSHVYDHQNSIMSLGYGLNLENLTGAVTGLWTQFTQAEFTCPQLVEAQNQAKAQSPAMIAMAVGMVQSVKGMGVSVYDIFIGPNMQPKKLSALVSIASSSPASLTGLTGMIPLPGLQGLQIPADGTPVEVNVPGAPANAKVFAAVKGNFITVYTGKEGESAANALATETLATKDLSALSINYSKFSNLLDTNMHLLSFIPDPSCISQVEMKDAFASLDGSLAWSNRFSATAFENDLNMDLQKYTGIKTELKGGFAISDFANGCMPTVIGRYEFKADGTGSEINTSNDTECNLAQTSFKWKEKAGLITFTSTSNQERFSCDQPLADAPAFTESCVMFNQSADRFDCIFNYGAEDPYLINVVRNP